MFITRIPCSIKIWISMGKVYPQRWARFLLKAAEHLSSWIDHEALRLVTTNALGWGKVGKSESHAIVSGFFFLIIVISSIVCCWCRWCWEERVLRLNQQPIILFLDIHSTNYASRDIAHRFRSRLAWLALKHTTSLRLKSLASHTRKILNLFSARPLTCDKRQPRRQSTTPNRQGMLYPSPIRFTTESIVCPRYLCIWQFVSSRWVP